MEFNILNNYYNLDNINEIQIISVIDINWHNL